MRLTESEYTRNSAGFYETRSWRVDYQGIFILFVSSLGTNMCTFMRNLIGSDLLDFSIRFK
jgi:hypothetical protein